MILHTFLQQFLNSTIDFKTLTVKNGTQLLGLNFEYDASHPTIVTTKRCSVYCFVKLTTLHTHTLSTA
jgi:hypothetical protein